MEELNLIHELRGSDFTIIHGESENGPYSFAQIAKYCKVTSSPAFIAYVKARGADEETIKPKKTE